MFYAKVYTKTYIKFHVLPKKSCNNGYHHKFPIFNDISHYFIETFRARFIKIFVQNDETFGFL